VESLKARWLILGFIGVTTLLRVAYALSGIDPLSGPDSQTYHDAAVAITHYGPLSNQIPAVPYWPVGYPAFVGFLYDLFGIGTRAVGVIQALAVGVAALAVLSTRRHFGLAVSGTAAVLVSVNTALFGASASLMYEPLLTAFLAVAAVLILDRVPLKTVGAFALLGIATVIQPKCLLVALAFLGWVAWRNRKDAAFSLVAFLTLPLVVSVSNLQNFGSPSLSANLGPTMRVGFTDRANGTYNGYYEETREGCREHADMFANDRSLVGCALGWAVRHPERLPKLEAMKAMAFWSPMSGVLAERGTWRNPIAVQYRYPQEVKDTPTYQALELGVSHAFVFVSMILSVVGGVVIWRRNRGLAFVWTIPVVVFFLVTLGTIGDPRFRLPVAPFYLLLEAQALAVVVPYLARLSPTLRSRMDAPSLAVRA
jgi:hypothetical protein